MTHLMFILAALTLLVQGSPTATAQPVPDHAVIFMYHHVSAETPLSTSVTPEQFADHLDHLSRHGFRVWPLPAVVDSLRHGGSLPDSVVVLTFDDGYRSVYTEAFPRLKERG
nr:polysaccharide deacetylase [Candidatus Krumholzibacteria bacterium]